MAVVPDKKPAITVTEGEGVLQLVKQDILHNTYQLRTLAFTLLSRSFRVMLCCMSDSISTWSVRYSGDPRLQPLATVSPTMPPPAPSSSLGG